MLGVALGRLQDEPVVVLEGPRSVGKSTLLHALTQRGGRILDLHDVATVRHEI